MIKKHFVLGEELVIQTIMGQHDRSDVGKLYNSVGPKTPCDRAVKTTGADMRKLSSHYEQAL